MTTRTTTAIGTVLTAAIDVIDGSSGGTRAETATMDDARTRTQLRRGRQVPYAEAIPRAGRADLIAIGCEALTDLHWALHAAQAPGVDPQWRRRPPPTAGWLELRERIGIAG